MRVLVAGASGQVALSLVEVARAHKIGLIALGRPQLDIGDEGSIARAVASVKPDLVINAAAYTTVDLAESEPEAARRINAIAPGWLAREAAGAGAPIMHISTDFVFDGEKAGRYAETNATGPLGVYGATKVEGEQSVAGANPRHLIARTAWVFSPFGKNSVKTILHLARDRPEVSVVADQVGTPTYAPDLAVALLDIAIHIAGGKAAEWGVVHIAAPDEASWADVADATFAASRKLGGPAASVKRIPSADFPTPTSRPANSRLSTDKLAVVYGLRLRPWRVGVEERVQRLLASETV